MALYELLLGGGCLSFIMMSLVQISPIKINPWTKLMQWFGNTVNGDIINEISHLKTKIQDLDERIGVMREEAREDSAVNCRTRILRFGDELLHDIHHSKEHFDQILDDINEYEIYCDIHPNFKNNQAVMTIKHIKSVYTECMEDRKFC